MPTWTISDSKCSILSSVVIPLLLWRATCKGIFTTKMSNLNDPTVAAIYRILKQQTGGQHTPLPVQPQRLPVSQLPSDRPHHQTNYASTQQNNSELPSFLRDINTRLNTLEYLLEQLKLMVAEHLGAIDSTMKRFEVMGRGVLDLALQGSQTEQLNPQASTHPPSKSHASQNQNLDKSFYERTGVDQTTTSFAPLLNSSPTLYPSQSSQGQYLDYDAMGLLGNDVT
ncbi:hypothetical protein F5884DRAFT_809142 [Xylogone sp. PMI_703]|nr:hypothetical protein F5884DRAFT_809142 [Xylogone sp. PMI_703]